MQTVVDTNFIIAIIFRDHEKHEEALKEWEIIEKAYLPLISLSELSYFLIKNGVNLEVVNEVISDPKIEIVPNTIEDVRFALANKEKIKGYDDFNDFLILSTAKRLDLPLLTFDKKLKMKS
ncbi:type II toxin-antitoxin system VapC family toxin [Saccharolobus solfataricus]|uniref:PIN domain-containing protein n=2 Tax=Saccharolobus solfataricus TaxID=2287 RepID=A0A0E3JUQ9_SACSO|nr:type II toxin-antitoxin system VapC family toxin [Saccharolobus solfataricus]AKA77300.1 type II toxin-antitoxin system VapC family toxin [Saccharolobus solfataricus]AKA79991.1 type II toxin-antitoxin system VapC family toxin [Saccharolobus solfataricus]AZF69072.1 type II toxin-antitoxin system VapC family toxin [Saccharolobus solfataricus]AZF71692.1 type II toxin-antitoxin system VapC family toxin [Saccharolobus solfataricus]